MTPPSAIRIGTRASRLAMAQTAIVAEALQNAWPGLSIDIVPFTTTGDQLKDKPLHELGGKGVFTKELEEALLEDRIDLAIHSLKDLPVTMPIVHGPLDWSTVLARQDVQDVLIVRDAEIARVQDLPPGSHFGTSSVRRAALLLDHRPDLRCVPMRGNVDTRLEKLRHGEFDAVVLARAGLNRIHADLSGLGVIDLDPAQFVPAAGQGALAAQFRADKGHIAAVVGRINHVEVEQAVRLERAWVRGLNGGCHSPIGAWAVVRGGQVTMHVTVAQPGGRPPIKRGHFVGKLTDAKPFLDKLLGEFSEKR